MGSFERRINKDVRYFQELAERDRNNSLNRVYHLHQNTDSESYSPESIRAYWARLAEDIRCGKKYELIELYVHVPFCINRCAYCNHYSKAVGRAEIEKYIEYQIASMRFFSSIFSQIKFAGLYIGGGTPNFLSNIQLKKLLNGIFDYFKFNDKKQMTFEFNPSNISYKKLDIIKNAGFNRISFGIQTFDRKVLSDINRPSVPYSSIKKIVSYAAKKGFEKIDADLIIDLKGHTSSSFIKTFYKAAKLSLTEIDVFPLTPTKEYIGKYFGGNLNGFYNAQKSIIKKSYGPIKSMAKQLGYDAPETLSLESSWGFMKKDRKFERSKTSDKNIRIYERYKGSGAGLNPETFSLLGFGPSARSHIYGYLSYKNPLDEYSLRFNGKRCIYRGTALSIKEEMTKYIIGCIIKQSKVSLKFFEERFNSTLQENFEYAIKSLEILGKIKIEKGFMYFLPVERAERFIYSMFFLSRPYLHILERQLKEAS